MGGYVIFGLILAAFAAPPIAAGRLYDEAKRLDREDRQQARRTPPVPPVTVQLAADTPEAAERRRRVALRMAQMQPESWLGARLSRKPRYDGPTAAELRREALARRQP